MAFKILETIEKESLAQARDFIKMATSEDRKKKTNVKILSSLRSLGVATQSELEDLQNKIQKLESRIQQKKLNDHPLYQDETGPEAILQNHEQD